MEKSNSHASSEVAVKHAIPQRRAGKGRIVIVVLALVAVLALALGLGLGLGLKKHSSSNSNANAAPPAASPSGTLTPQSASAFALNPSPSSPPQTRTYEFNLTSTFGSPDGFQRQMFVVNGLFPGPTIEANQGDRLVVTVHNGMANTTSIHWHGLFQNGTNFYDGTQGITECGIPPGDSLTYNFTFGEFSGTTWWHAHASTLYTDGVFGALIVHPTNPPASIPEVKGEHVLMLHDWYHTQSGDLLEQYFDPFGLEGTPGNEPVPDSGTINGFGQYNNTGGYFNLTLDPAQTYRLRLVNTGSFASVRFSIDSHPLTVIEADGSPVEPRTVDGVVLGVAQRYDVLVHTNATDKTGVYWMRNAVQDDMFTYDEPGANYDIRGILRYSTSNSTSLPTASDPPSLSGNPGDLDTSVLVPSPPSNGPPSADKTFKTSFFFEFAADGRWRGFMNTTSWAPLGDGQTTLSKASSYVGAEGGDTGVDNGDQFVVSVGGVQVVDLIIDNLDDGDHPFHLHGHRPWIVGNGDGRYIGQTLNATNALRRDTVIIPQYTWVALRFVSDNPGMWAFHCHIAWHMAGGLLMQIAAQPSVAAALTLPADIVRQCAAQAKA